ncbi:hypothetical protein ALC53_04108 [Atta colombica]|uniref:Uncharacterized protein n=1 Tax=Atta colombica TaxID=520822 RepID=A0A195BMN2_9HYME|nr:hypothetical protein ALC53_04108 [Atta colombica]
MRIRVIFSPVWLHEEALARLPVPLHLGRSMSRLPNCLNSRARVYHMTSDPLVITIHISMRTSRRESIRLSCSRDSSTRWSIECGVAPRREEFFEFFGNKATVNQELKTEEGLQIHHTCFKDDIITGIILSLRLITTSSLNHLSRPLDRICRKNVYTVTNANVERGSLTLAIILGWYAAE